MIFACQLALASLVVSPRHDGQQRASGSGQKPEPHVEEGRVKINLETPEMTLAQDNKIPLGLHGYSVSNIILNWDFAEPGFEGRNPGEPEGLSLQQAPDGSAYVNFVPTHLGKLQLRILVTFQDGGVDADSVTVNVDRLPDRPPLRFILSSTLASIDFRRKAGTMHLDLSSNFNKQLVVPVAFYHGIQSPIPLYPLTGNLRNQIAFSVIPKGNQPPPVEYDPATAEVKAIRLGQALIKATLDNKSAYACVDVSRDAREAAQYSDCSSFLPAGLTEPIDERLELPQPAQPVRR